MNKQQIAAEAADKIANALNSKTATIRKPQLAAIIESAIEKAYCYGVDEMTKAGVEAVNESRAAHASEQDDTKRLEYLMRFFRNLIREFGFRGGLDRQQIDVAMRKDK